MRYRPGHQQHVGVARRRDEALAEALEIIERVVERMNLQLAAIARSGIDLADRQAAAEPRLRNGGELGGELGQPGLARRQRRLGQRPVEEGAADQVPHGARSILVGSRFDRSYGVGGEVVRRSRLE